MRGAAEMNLPVVLRDLMSLPTAPFCEGAVADYVERFCRGLAGVTLRKDRCGNLRVHYRHRPRKLTPMAFAAHLDHPGFVAREMTGPKTVRAEFRGGVRPEYFAGSAVRFWSDGAWVKGRVRKLTKALPPTRRGGPRVPQEARVDVRRAVRPNSLGMWDLPDPVLKDDRVIGRACDDLAGVGAMLTLLQRLSKKQAAGEVFCLFTRAEEVGFVGALGAIRARTLPKKVPVLSIETSSALVNAPIGAGPIIRVGDRGCLYDADVVAFCVRAAEGLAKRKRKFAYQRKLMDGGMCEAAAFGTYGYRTAGICLALGNYHNMDTKRGKIASEWVSLRDWQGMVDLFEALVLDKTGPDVPDEALRTRLDKLLAEHEELLMESAAD
jgi:putative aminopeptidase FrvX